MKENHGLILILVLFNVSHLVAVENVAELLGARKRGHPVLVVTYLFENFRLLLESDER